MIKTESYKKGIIASTALNIIVKGLGFLNIVIIAYYFGTTKDTDIYFYVFSIVTLIAGFINGMEQAVIMPEGMNIHENNGISEAIKFYNSFGIMYILIGLFLFLIFFLFSIPVYNQISSFGTKALNQQNYLLLLSSPLPLLIIFSNYLGSVLTTFKYFTAPLIANGIVQIFAVTFMIIFHGIVGINSILIGTLIGYIFSIFSVLTFMIIKLNWGFNFSFRNLSIRVKRNLLFVQLGNFVTLGSNYGMILLISSIGTGIYSAYNYSMQIINIPNTFIVVQTSAVTGIKFNNLATQKAYKQINKVFQDTLNFLLFLIVPVCLLIWLYASDIVNFLFVHGNFTRESSNQVSTIIKYLIFLLPCLTINTFLARILSSIKKVNESFYLQIFFNSGMLLVVFILTQYFGLKGFMAGMLFSYYTHILIVCTFFMKKMMPELKYTDFLKTLFQIALLNLVPFIIAIFSFNQLFFIIPVLYFFLLIKINKMINLVPEINLLLLKFYKF